MSISGISQLLLTRFLWNFQGWLLGTSKTDSNCHSDICAHFGFALQGILKLKWLKNCPKLFLAYMPNSHPDKNKTKMIFTREPLRTWEKFYWKKVLQIKYAQFAKFAKEIAQNRICHKTSTKFVHRCVSWPILKRVEKIQKFCNI